MASIADLYLAKGNAEAAAILQRGNIYADLIRNLSSVPGQIIQNQRANQQEELKRQLVQSQVATAAGEQQLTAQKVVAGQQQQQNADVLKSALNDPSIYNPNGTFNKAGLRDKLTASGNLHLLPQLNEMSDHLDASAASAEEKQNALVTFKREEMGKDAQQIEAAGNDAGLFHQAVIQRAKLGWIPQDQANAYLQLSTPDQVASVVKQWKAGTKAGTPNLKEVPQGGSLYDLTSGKPVFTSQAKPEAPTKASLAADLSSADPAVVARAKTALAALDEGDNTVAKMDAAAEALYAKQAAAKRGGPALTPEEGDRLKAYEKRKTVVTDDAAVQAANRQTAAIGAQIAQQQRGQNFDVLKTARADIQKNADTPYQTAKAAANELRDVVTAAQGGNKIAAAEQPLAVASSVVKSFGLNRINTAEIGVPAGAGSAVDRFLGWVGKFKDGQPIDAAVQKDMLQVADMLEKKAAKTYMETHGGINKLYGTSIPPTYDVKAPAATPSTGKTGTVGKYTYTVD